MIAGLLWCNVGFASSIYDFVHEGMTKKQLRKLTHPYFGFGTKFHRTNEIKKLGGWSNVQTPFCSYGKYGNHHRYFLKYKTEIFTHSNPLSSTADGYPWYVFENVTIPITCSMGGPKKSNGTLKALVWSKEEALVEADPVYAKKLEQKKREEEEKLAKKRKKEKKKKRTKKKMTNLEDLIKDFESGKISKKEFNKKKKELIGN